MTIPNVELLRSLQQHGDFRRMKRNVPVLILSSLILLASTAAMAADTAKTAPKATSVSRKGILPPPPPDAAIVTRKKRVRVMPTDAQTTSATDEIVTVGTAGPYTARDNKVQRFTDYLDVKEGQTSAPLTMRIENNGFSWFRMFISNELIATDKDLKGGSGEIDLSGVAQTGNNQIVIQAGGAPGAQISWKVTTKAAAKLDSVDPDEALVGDEIKLKGQRFSVTASENKVYFNNKAGEVKSATAKEIKVKIPKDVEIGENKVSVKVGGQSTNSLKMKIRGIPEITSSNLQGVAPGQTIIIYGKNFSKDMKENKVYFGDTPAEIVSGGIDNLTVIAPYNAPAVDALTAPMNVKVQVGKIASKNTIPIQLGPKMFHDPGVFVGPDTPVLPAGF
jgi:hypothetical protein